MKPWRAALTSATASGKSTRIASRSATACSSALPEGWSWERAAPVSSTAVFSVSVANCSRCASCTVSACCSANSRRPRRRSSGSPPNGKLKPPLPSMHPRLAAARSRQLLLVRAFDLLGQRLDGSEDARELGAAGPVEVLERGDPRDGLPSCDLVRKLAQSSERDRLANERALRHGLASLVEEEPRPRRTSRIRAEVDALPGARLGGQHRVEAL